jgi:hypothetical protein
MTSIELLIANALVPADFVPDLLRDMTLPALDMVASQGTAREVRAPHADLLPAWLGWAVRDLTEINVALGWSRALGVPLAPGFHRFLGEPVHFEVGQRGLRLEDPARLDIASDEAQMLLEAITPLVQAAGGQIVSGDANHLLIDLPDEVKLRAPLAELALYEEVLPWMPQGEGARQWRRLSTEIEMVLHDHPLNEMRAARGASVISGLWLSGNSSAQDAPALGYQSISDVPAWLSAWPLQADSLTHLEGISQLSAPYFEEDWSAFRNALFGVDQRLMRHLTALRAGDIGRLTVILSGGTWLREVVLKRADLYKFWRRGKAFELFDLPE